MKHDVRRSNGVLSVRFPLIITRLRSFHTQSDCSDCIEIVDCLQTKQKDIAYK